MVFEHQGSYQTQAGAIGGIARKIGCIPQTMSGCVRQAKKDSGMRDGVTAEERDRIKALERENRELRQANEILRKGEPVKAPFAALSRFEGKPLPITPQHRRSTYERGQRELDRPLKR